MKNRCIFFAVLILIISSLFLTSCDEFLNELEEYSSVSSSAVNSNSSQNDDETQSSSVKYTDEEELHFRNDDLLVKHYKKHGKEMGFSDKYEYEKAAAKVVVNPDALHKIEKEDGDDIYYIESTNEFVVVSKDGYIRTYFNPDAGIKYYNKQ